MKRKNTHLAAVAFASFLGSAALSQAAVLWQLDFNNYGNGDLNTNPVAQSGFPGNFFDGSATVTSGVITSGNTKATLNQTFTTAVGATGTLWLSFDWGHNNSGDHASTYGGLTFFEDQYPTLNEKGLLGNNWDTATWTGTSISNIGMKTAIAKITLSDTGSDTVELWVGTGTGSAVDVSGTAAATLSMELSSVNAFRFNGGNNQQFDNLVVGTTNLDIAATAPTAAWMNTGGGTWGTAAGAGSNWLNAVVGGGSGNTANFNTLNITADTTVNLDSARTIGNLVFGDTDTSTAAGWTLANNGNGSNILTLSGTTPTITVNALGGSKTATISAVVAGTEGLTKAGTGTLTLTGANTYTGTTTVNNGTLKLQGDAFTTTARDYTIATGAVLNLDGNTGVATGTTTLSGTGTLRITGGTFANESPNANVGPGRSLTMAMGTGSLIDVQSGATMYNGGWQNVTWTNNKADLNADGTFNLADGNAVLVDALTGAGTVTGNAGKILTVGVDNGGGPFSGALSGGMGLTKNGTGTQTLSGAISYTGNTTVNNGTLVVSGQSYFNVGRTTTVASVAVFELYDSNNGFNSLMPTSTITGAGTFRLSGNSAISQDNNGSSGDRLIFAMDAGGLIDLQGTSRLTNGGWQQMKWTDNKASMNIASGATFDGWDGQPVTIDALTGSGTVDKTHGGNSPTSLTVGIANGSGTFSGTIQNTAAQLAITKVGSGTQTLSGTNTYDGATTVSQGTLLINGNQSGASGALSVASGATLGGSGIVGGATTIASGAHLGVGTSTGTQTFNSTLTFDSGSIFDWELDADTADMGSSNQGAYDKVVANDNVTGTSVFTIALGTNAFTDFFWDTNKSWSDIFTGIGSFDLSTLFTTFGGPGVAANGLVTGEGQFSFTSTTLNWTAVPEPTSALAGLLLTAGLLRRRRAVENLKCRMLSL